MNNVNTEVLVIDGRWTSLPDLFVVASWIQKGATLRFKGVGGGGGKWRDDNYVPSLLTD